MFKDKVIIITGGTGSFGNAVLRRFLNTDVKEIRIFSRDEKKQDDMRKLYNNTKIDFRTVIQYPHITMYFFIPTENTNLFHIGI